MHPRKTIRRLFSLLLVLSMVLGLFPATMVPARAAEEKVYATGELRGEIAALAAPVVNHTQKVDLSTAVQQDMAGAYVLVTTASDGTLYALQPQIADGHMSTVKIAVENGRIVNPDTSMLTYLVKGGTYHSYYSLRNYDRQIIDISTKTAPAGSANPKVAYSYYSSNEESFYAVDLYTTMNPPKLRIARWVDVTGDGLGDVNVLSCDGVDASFRYVTTGQSAYYMEAYGAEVLTRDLFDLLQAAAPFTGEDAAFDAASYSTFIAAVESAITLYHTYNRELSSDMLSAAKAELDGGLLALREAMFALGNSLKAAAIACWLNTIRMPTGAAKYGNQRVDLTGVTATTKLDFLDRNYFFAALADGTYYIFDKNSTNDGVDTPFSVNALVRGVAAEGKHIAGTNGYYQFSALTLSFLSQKADGRTEFRTGTARDYYLSFSGDKFVKTRDEKKQDGYPLIRSTDGQTVAIMNPKNNLVVGLSSDKKTFELHADTGTATDRFYLYRYLWSVDELYTAMAKTMKPYLTNPEEYGQSYYSSFLNTMESCLELFDQYNIDTVDLSSAEARRSENIQEVIRDSLNDLLGHKTLLDDTMDYIDIPVTMMDFRSDGLLMQTQYHLFLQPNANVKDPQGNPVSLPGSLLYPNETGVGNIRRGLTELTLTPEGKVKYTKELVTYVAASLYSGCVQDLSWHGPQNPVSNINAINGMNDTFIQIAGAISSNKPGTQQKNSNGETVTITYGTYDETEKKAKDNGGMFTWDQVTTWFDMAYYVLTYLWQPVPPEEAEKLPDGFLYNQVVPEITTMRMYKDDNGEYIFTSEDSARFGGSIGRLSYSSPYMYNSTASTGVNAHPRFAPLDGLGFESDPYFETDVGNSRGYGYRNNYIFGSNFNFSMHAHGSFIYYEDQDLYFNFRGDDDVMFFINGRMACDIGAAHGAMPGELNLNDKAEELGLKDGEIYTFDMFYAERNATGSNITFTTNIKILDNETVTSKGQYLEVSDGKSVVDPATSMGGRLDNNSFVGKGDTIAYSFELLNKRQVPVYNVTFEDSTLGVELSPDFISLSNPAVSTNGVTTTLSDLVVMYRSCDATGTVDTQTPVQKDYHTFLTEILTPALTGQTATDGTTIYDSFPTGSYRVRIDREDQLKTLLRLGIPSQCQLILYGFKRNTVSGDNPYTNILRSTCYYDHPLRKSVEIKGSASRSIRVMEQHATDLPTADLDQVVLDYDKPVYIPLDELRNHIYTNRDVSVGDLVGFLPTGVHGTFLKNEPTNMILVNNGDSHKGAFGTFARQENTISYTPDKFLTNTDSVYAVIALENCYTADAENPEILFPCNFMLVEVRIQPATITYYETDFAEGIFKTTTKIDGEEVNGEWTEDEETPFLTRIHKEDVPDNAFFVDFVGTGYLDRYRDNPIYGGMDLDNLAYWVSFTDQPANATVKNHPTMNQKDGTISVSMKNITNEDGTLKPSSGAIYVQTGRSINWNYDLRFKPANNMFLQMRFKLENFNPPDGKADLALGYYTWSTKYADGAGDSDEINSNYIASLTLTEEHVSGEFVTVRLPVTDPKFAKERFLTAIRPSFRGLTSISAEQLGKLTIDYIYLGPEIGEHQDHDRAGDIYYSMEVDRELIPDNAFFVDFDGDGYENRYKDNPLYKGVDFDRGGWGYDQSAVSAVEYDTVNKETMALTVTQPGAVLALDHIFAPYSGDSAEAGEGVLLDYKPSDMSFVELRVRFDGFSNTTSMPGVSAVYYVPDGDGYQEKALTTEQDILSPTNTDRGENSERPVESLGKYVTIRMEVTDQFYRETVVKGFSIRFTKLEGSGTITIDYIYIGPAYAPAAGTNAPDYFYFGFDDTPSDDLRYDTALYGHKDFDEEENWNTQDRFNLTANGGVALLESTAVMANAEGCYGSLGISGISYTPVEKDYLQIRFRVDGVSTTVPGATGASQTVENGRLTLYYNGTRKPGAKTGTSAAHYNFPITEVNNQGWITWTLPVDGIITDDRGAKFAEFSNISSLTLAFSQMGVQTGKIHYQVDYFYVGPYTYLPDQDTGAAPLTDNALFFDFTNTDADKVRYSSPVYGGYNYDLLENWYWAHTVSDPVTIENGELILTDKSYGNKIEFNSVTSKVHSLRYEPGDQDYCIARVKLVNAVNKPNMTDNGGIGYSNNGRIEFSLYCYYEGYDNYNSWRDMGSTFIDPRDADGDYMTLCFPLNSQYYLNADRITAVQPQFHICDSKSQTEKAVLTIDYLYVGPLSQGLANPTVRSLYFNFDDTSEDRIRYENDSYGYIQHDTQGTWGFNGSRDKSVTTDNEKGIVTIDTTGLMGKDAEDGFSWIQTGLMGEGTVAQTNSEPILDFHPDEAQIAQIRFRIEGLRQGTSDGLVYLQYFYDGIRPDALATAGTATVDGEKLTNGEWVTATIPLNDEFRNCNSITGICPGFHRIYWAEENEPINIIVDYVYVGPGEIPPVVYGYDNHYTDDPGYSDYSSLFTVGRGINLPSFTGIGEEAKTYTEAEFTFTGTGFDLISRTGVEQATIRVAVYNSNGDPVKSMTVNNKGELELYQIPVVSVQGLAYDTYRVVIGVQQPVDSPYEFLSRGGDFYFDAVRIYDPMPVNNQEKWDELYAYRIDKEAYQHFKEIRNIILEAEDVNDVEAELAGAIFVDAKDPASAMKPTIPGTGTTEPTEATEPTESDSTHITASVQTYNKIGPKNEVYLDPGQAVAFKILIASNQNPYSIDIGAKTLSNSKAKLMAGFVAIDSTQTDPQKAVEGVYAMSAFVESSTAQYYALPCEDAAIFKGSPRSVYLVIYNGSEVDPTAENRQEQVLSITDMKIAYKAHPDSVQEDLPNDPPIFTKGTITEPVRCMVDSHTLFAAETFIGAQRDQGGSEESVEVDPSVEIKHTLNLASDISINYVVPVQQLEGCTNMVMTCRIPVYEGNALVGEKEERLQPILKGDYYYFTLEGLTAVQIHDVITAYLEFTREDRTWISETDAYSISDYAYNQLEKVGATQKLKTVCAELLRYGAAAQIFKDYRTETLADSKMTAAHKAYLSDMEAVTFGNTNKVLNDLENAPIIWAGKTLNLESKVALKFVFSTAGYNGNLEDLNLRVSYTDIEDKTVTAMVEGIEAYNAALQQYAFSFDGLLAAELRSVVSVQVYAGNVPVSCTLQYSASSYGNGKTGELLTVCKALMAYSDSAKAYFMN